MASSNPTPPTASAESATSSGIHRKWGYTQVKVVKLSYMWTISNFSLCPQEFGEVLESPIFTAGINDELKWRLDMYPKGDRQENKDYVSIFVRLIECTGSQVKAKFSFSIIDRKMKKTNLMYDAQVHTFDRVKSKSRGYPKFVRLDSLTTQKNDLLPDDKLTICCEVELVPEIVNISGKNKDCGTCVIPKYRVLDDFETLLDSEKFFDVTMAVGQTEFRAHKAILASRSRVFSAMFDHDMEETKKNRVEIIGMDADVFGVMLRFIYTGRLDKGEKMADGLLAVADKYDLERLKAMSEAVLCKDLTIDNAAESLMLADLHCAEQLKSQAIDFINGHANEVMETPGFKSMLATKPYLIADVLRALALRKNSDVDELFEIQQKRVRLEL